MTPMKLPEPVLRCIRILEDRGYTAYAVGGCVRDHLLGLQPHDYDLCTNAKPETLCALFSQYPLVRNGEKHGTIGVVMDGEVYEITTYRTEGGYTDSRHPDWVAFVDGIEADLARRDFTVNAMAYSPTRGYADPFGGQADLKNKVLRAVGEPEKRFREDALRILRGVRFAARFGLEPEEKTLAAMTACVPLMDTLARERVLTELIHFLPHAQVADLLRFAPILTAVIPELRPCLGFDQRTHHHIYDIYTHTAHTVAAVDRDPALRLAALLHDIGKPQCFTLDGQGQGHFYGHAKAGGEITGQLLRRLKASNAFREEVTVLVTHHMDLFQADKKLIQRYIGKYGEETTRKLVLLHRADLLATGTADAADMARYDDLQQLIDQVLEEQACLGLGDLAISGTDLIRAGFTPGPRIGKCLTSLLEQVQEETLPNEKESLLTAAMAFRDA